MLEVAPTAVNVNGLTAPTVAVRDDVAVNVTLNRRITVADTVEVPVIEGIIAANLTIPAPTVEVPEIDGTRRRIRTIDRLTSDVDVTASTGNPLRLRNDAETLEVVEIVASIGFNRLTAAVMLDEALTAATISGLTRPTPDETFDVAEIPATTVGLIRPTAAVIVDEAEITSVDRLRMRPIAAETFEVDAIDAPTTLLIATRLALTVEVDEIAATGNAR